VVTKTREWMSALAVAGCVAATGLLLGLVWYLSAPTLPLRKVEQGMAYIVPDPEQTVAADGWFVLLGLGLGLIAAILVWIFAAKTRGPIQLAGLALGAIAAGYVAWQFTVFTFDQSGYAQRAKQAQLNDIVQRPAELGATNSPVCLPGVDKCRSVRSGELWVPAFGAVVTYSLMAGWSRWPGLRREEEEAGPQFFEGAGPS
jgi:hypothetical protein